MRQGPSRFPRSRAIAAAAVLGAAACATLPEPRAPGEPNGGPTEREIEPGDVSVPPGYRVEVVAAGLSAPSAIAFDEGGRVHLLVAGDPSGQAGAPPRLLQVAPDGALRSVASGDHAPWTGVTWHDGAFYVAAAGAREGAGQLLRITPDGVITPILEGLPSIGDHPVSGPVVGPDGQLYLGVGAATNAGVVGEDNVERGWVRRFPAFHDIACKDIVLVGDNYRTPNALTEAEGDEVATGGYAPFGQRVESGQLLTGKVPCTGAVLRVAPAGGAPELVAWGLRDPLGLVFTPDGRLLATDTGMEPRGSRPVEGAPDVLWVIEPGRWYGWPDFAAGEPVWRRREGAGSPAPMLFATHPDVPPAPAARFAPRSLPRRLDVSRNPAFGHAGAAFVPLSGSGQVVRVDLGSGAVAPFATIRAEGGQARPIDARFDPSGAALYVLEQGVAQEATGVLWRITRQR